MLGGPRIGGGNGSRPGILNAGRVVGSGTYWGWTRTTAGGVIEAAGGELQLPGRFEIADATARAAAGATLNLNTHVPFPIYGSTLWAGAVTIDGGGLVRQAGQGTATLSNAAFTVAPDTRFEWDGACSGGLTVEGAGSLAVGGTLTVRRANFYAGFANAGTVVLAGGSPAAHGDVRFHTAPFTNTGTLVVATPGTSHVNLFNNTVTNAAGGLIDFRSDAVLLGQSTLVRNLGTVRQSAGVTSTYHRYALDNLGGTLDVRAGTFRMANSFGPDAADPDSPRGKLATAFGSPK